MKTITELQADVRTITAQMETLSNNLAALQKAEAPKGLDLRAIETIGAQYPFSGHALKGASQELQTQYFTLLAGVLLLECKNVENGWMFIQRLLTTTGCKHTLEEIHVYAATGSAERLAQTAKAIRAKGLEQAMLMDLMLVYLACAGGSDGKDYIASVAQLLGAHTETLQEIAELATLIAQKDEKGFRRFAHRCTLELKYFRAYTSLVTPYIVQTHGNTMYVYGDGKTPIEQEIRKTIKFDSNIRRIEIYNTVFTRTLLRFCDGNSLLLDGCTIRDIEIAENSVFLCQNINEVKTYDCRFDSLTSNDYTINFCVIDTLQIQDSTFSNIRGTASDGYAWNFSGIKHGCLKNVTAKKISGRFWLHQYSCCEFTTSNCFCSQCSGDTSLGGFRQKDDL